MSLGYDEEEREDVMQEIQHRSLEAGVFGVFYTISREKQTTAKKWAILTILVDFAQMVAFTLNPSFDWAPQIDDLWRYLNYFTIKNPLVSLGYTAYLVCFGIAAAILTMSLVICGLVAHHFKTNSFPWVWPVKFVRTVFALLIGVFFISTIKIFLTILACTTVDGVRVLNDFRDVECWVMPHIVLAILGIIFSFAFLSTALGVALISFEPSLNTKDLLASAVGRRELQEFVLKTAMTCSDMLLFDSPRIQSGMLFATSALLVYDLVRFVPHYHQWINTLRTGLYTVVTWCSLVLLVKQLWLDPGSYVDTVTWVMLGGIPVSFIGGALTAFFRMRQLDGTRMLKRVYAEGVDGGEFAVTSDFLSERHPEVAVRFVQGRANNEQVVAAGTALLRHATRQYPESALVHIVFASYILAYEKRSDQAQMLMDKARRMHPSFVDRFCLFLRDRERMQRQQAASTGETTMDLVSYIEFQNKYKTAVHSYKSTLRSIRSFWRLVMSPEVTMSLLSESFHDIDRHQERAERTYRSLLENYPKSVQALRSFARFCEDIKGDVGSAHKYNNEADKQEDLASEARRKRASESGTDVVDDKVDATIVADSTGTITFANNITCKLFGWKKDDLVGRNLSVLVPSPLAEQHDSFIRKYVETGKSAVLGTTRRMDALHKQGHTFPVKLSVSRIDNASGMSFVGVFRPVTDEDVCRVTINAYGIIQSCTKALPPMFGYRNVQDLVGQNVQILMPTSIDHDAMMQRRRDRGHAANLDFAARRLLGRRSDGSEFPVAVDLEMVGEEGENMMFVGTLRELNDGIGVVTSNEAGIILSANKQVSDLFGYASGALMGQNVSKLMPQPYSTFHDFWVKRYHSTGVASVIGRSRRLTVMHIDGTLFDVNMDISFTESDGKKTFLSRISNCDSRVDEAHRTDSSNACTVTLNDDLVVSNIAGGIVTVFEVKDQNTILGRAFSDLIVEEDLTPDVIVSVAGGVIATPARGNGEIGEPAIIKCEIVHGIPGMAYNLFIYTLTSLDCILGLRVDGSITYANEFAHILFGSNALVGQNVRMRFRDHVRAGLSSEDLQALVEGNAAGKKVSGRRTGMARRDDNAEIGIIVEIAACDSQFFNNAQLAARVCAIGHHGTGEEWAPPRTGASSISPRIASPKPRFVRFSASVWDELPPESGAEGKKGGAAAGAADEAIDTTSAILISHNGNPPLPLSHSNSALKANAQANAAALKAGSIHLDSSSASGSSDGDDEEEETDEDESGPETKPSSQQQQPSPQKKSNGTSSLEHTPFSSDNGIKPTMLTSSSDDLGDTGHLSSNGGSTSRPTRRRPPLAPPTNGLPPPRRPAQLGSVNLNNTTRRGTGSTEDDSRTPSSESVRTTQRGVSPSVIHVKPDGIVMSSGASSSSASEKKKKKKTARTGHVSVEIPNRSDVEQDDLEDFDGSNGGVQSAISAAHRALSSRERLEVKANSPRKHHHHQRRLHRGDSVDEGIHNDRNSIVSHDENNGEDVVPELPGQIVHPHQTNSSRKLGHDEAPHQQQQQQQQTKPTKPRPTLLKSGSRLDFEGVVPGTHITPKGGMVSNDIHILPTIADLDTSPSSSAKDPHGEIMSSGSGSDHYTSEESESTASSTASSNSASSSTSSVNSMNSVSSAFSTGGEGGETSRSKKFKRVARVLRLGRIRRLVKGLHFRVWMTIMLVLVTEVVFFSVLRTRVSNYLTGMGRMLLAGDAAHHAQRMVSLAVRAPFASVAGEWSSFGTMMIEDSDELDNRIQTIYLGSVGKSGDIHSFFEVANITIMEWAGAGATASSTYIFRNVSLWDFGRGMVQAGRQVGTAMKALDTSVVNTAAWHYLVDNGPENFCVVLASTGYKERDQWVDDMYWLNLLYALLIVAEILIVFFSWALVVTPAFNIVFFERHKLFGYFLAVPPGVALKLATQSITMDDEEDGDDDDEEEEEDWANNTSTNPNGNNSALNSPKRKPNTDDDHWGEDFNDNNNNNDNNNSMGNTHESEGGSQQRSRKSRFGNNKVAPMEKGRNGKRIDLKAELRKQQARRHRHGTGLRARAFRFFRHLVRLLSLKKVQHRLRKLGRIIVVGCARHFLGRASKARRRRRQLPVGNDRTRFFMSAPMLLIVLLLIISLILSITYLQRSRIPSVEINTTEQRQYLAFRVHYLCEMVVFRPDANVKTLPLLDSTVSQLRTLHSDLVSASTSRTTLQSTLLFDQGCLRHESTQCRSSSDRFASRVFNGLDALVQNFLFEAQLIYVRATTTNSSSLSWQFVDDVIWRDLTDGLETSGDRTLQESKQLSPADVVGQSLIFVAVLGMLWLLFVAAYKPFERKTITETRRATIMLTLLPDYIDLSSLT